MRIRLRAREKKCNDRFVVFSSSLQDHCVMGCLHSEWWNGGAELYVARFFHVFDHRRRKHGGNGGIRPQSLKAMGALPP